jgi:hypothetical protein
MDRLIALLFFSFILTGCGGREDTEVVPVVIDGNTTPDSFLTYVNDQAQVTAGEYQVVVAPETEGQTGSYELVVTLPDGSEQIFTGSWPITNTANAATVAATPIGNPSHSITIDATGELDFQLTSSVPGHLYLMKNGLLVAEQAATETTLSWNIAASEINSEAYANAYYQRVDPDDERTTLSDWQSVNGFDQGNVTHLVFRDTKDLGYGRDMYARKSANGDFAVYVDNYVVILRPGDSANYGPLNLDAALLQDRDRHIGSNAIEFSRLDPDDPNSPRVLKFFTFAPAGEDGEQQRIIKANLDGRGIKYMPTMCLVCHGGTMLPLNEDGSFPDQSILTAKFNRLELDSFEYGELPGQTREDQEPYFKQLNQWIHQSYQDISQRDVNTRGKWWADFAIEILEGHYGGTGLPLATYQEGTIPNGWRANPSRPEGVELLYTEVVEPHCISCHSLRGTEAGNRELAVFNGQTLSLANSISFSSYEQFISYNDKIIDYVYRRGVMPLSLRNYEKFWEYPTGAPSMLASFLSGFDVFNEQREVVEPGRAVARAGENREAVSPVQLNGSGSHFATEYLWSVVSAPVGAAYSFSDDSIVSPVFTADTDGEYQLSLQVNNSLNLLDSEEITLTIDQQRKDQVALTFVDDIRPMLGSDSNTKCSSCHNTLTGRRGIPVYYDDNNQTLYQDVLARVNLSAPQDSLLLLKPTQLQHGGGVQLDRTTVEGEREYQTLLNWIQEGALCGKDTQVCP